MNDHVTFFSKLSLTGIITMAKIYFVSIVNTLIAFLTCLSIHMRHLDSETNVGSGAPHVDGQTGIYYVLLLIYENPIESTIYACVIGICFILLGMGFRYTIRKLAIKVVSDKKQDVLFPLIVRIIASLKEKSPKSIQSATNFLQAKVQILQAIKSSGENKWLRKAAAYGIRKVESLDLNFEKENFNALDEIKLKAFQYFNRIQKPSKNWFFIGLLIQWLMVLLLYLYL